MTGHTRTVWDMRLSADEEQLLSASADRTLRVWRCADGFVRRTSPSAAPRAHGTQGLPAPGRPVVPRRATLKAPRATLRGASARTC